MQLYFFFFNDTATTEIYTLSLHDALPISIDEARGHEHQSRDEKNSPRVRLRRGIGVAFHQTRSEEHTSELQSLRHLVCRLLPEKKIVLQHSSTVAGEEMLVTKLPLQH